MTKARARFLLKSGWSAIQEHDTGITYLAKNYNDKSRGNEKPWDDIVILPQSLVGFAAKDCAAPIHRIYATSRDVPKEKTGHAIMNALRSMVMGA